MVLEITFFIITVAIVTFQGIEGVVENPKPGIIFDSRPIRQPRVLQPGSIELREINPWFSVHGEGDDMEPFLQVLMQLVKALSFTI